MHPTTMRGATPSRSMPFPRATRLLLTAVVAASVALFAAVAVQAHDHQHQHQHQHRQPQEEDVILVASATHDADDERCDDASSSSSSSTCSSSSSSSSAAERAPTTQDPLFREIERQQQKASSSSKHHHPHTTFGRLLDAGTGEHSLRWIASLVRSNRVSSWAAITASDEMRDSVVRVAKDVGLRVPPEDDNDYDDKDEEKKKMVEDEEGLVSSSTPSRSSETKETNDKNKCEGVIVGDWFAPDGDDKNIDDLCSGATFDTIVVDYLVGAIDGFSPYRQDQVFDRLKQHLTPGTGRMYVVGLEPIPHVLEGDANVISKMKAVRDASILLAGQRPYREYPLEWIVRNMKRSNLTVRSTSKFPIRYRVETISDQLQVARSKFESYATRGLSDEMAKYVAMLEEEARIAIDRAPGKVIESGFDYLVVCSFDG